MDYARQGNRTLSQNLEGSDVAITPISPRRRQESNLPAFYSSPLSKRDHYHSDTTASLHEGFEPSPSASQTTMQTITPMKNRSDRNRTCYDNFIRIAPHHLVPLPTGLAGFEPASRASKARSLTKLTYNPKFLCKHRIHSMKMFKISR